MREFVYRVDNDDMVFPAEVGQISSFLQVIETRLDSKKISVKLKHNIIMVAEELFSNIAQYAYKQKVGAVCVALKFSDKSIDLVFKDMGKPYNPLNEKQPDISLSVDEQQIGGWGIYLVKKLSDGVAYKYQNGQNILKVTFVI